MKQWIDRNWNLIFHKKKCWKLVMNNVSFEYNDVIISSDSHCTNHYRYLGRGHYKLIKNEPNDN